MGLLDGRVAFVTGAARGQGRSHAIRLASEGADILAFDICREAAAVNYRVASSDDLDETVDLIKEVGGRVHPFVGDVRDSAALDRAAADAAGEFGHIDVVVVNAGILTWDRFWEISDEDWQATIDINLTGAWRTMKAVTPIMIESGRGGS